jgi:hypothetical protein
MSMKYARNRKIKLHPASDRWMEADNHGIILGEHISRISGEPQIRVRMDGSTHDIWVSMHDILPD